MIILPPRFVVIQKIFPSTHTYKHIENVENELGIRKSIFSKMVINPIFSILMNDFSKRYKVNICYH